ncbi:MAG: DciA family protein [Candidatus Accumulibacter sp.]|jgi:hypothetical protein|nr:DciA family protein [Accumulibacter sp.]
MRDKTLENFLDSADGAGMVLAHARELLRLSGLYRQIAPAYLSEASRLVNYKSGTVIVHAANGATAAKLRQLATTLADGFSRRGVECGKVEVRVRAIEFQERPASPRQKPLSGRTFQTLGRLRDTLSDSELRQAVDSLIRRSARLE